MKATAGQIIAKIIELPLDIEDLVTISSPTSAEVQSFRADCTDVWIARIKPHKDDPGDRTILDVSCTCPAVKLCHHISAFYAIAKKSEPAVIVAMAKRKGVPADPPTETVPKKRKKPDAPLSRRAEGLKLIAASIEKVSEAFQDLADGIALIVKEVANEDGGD